MPERSPGAARWMRDLLGRSTGEPPRHADWGEARVRSGLSGLLELERRISEAVCFAVDAEPSFAPRGVTRCADEAGALASAYGMALTGRRVAAFARLDGAGRVVDRLVEIVERHVPLVLYAIADTSGDIAALAATGAPVAVARDGSHALDLALIARRVAESTLIPAVVVVERAEVARAMQDLKLPPAELIEEYLGGPNDQIASPTAAQQMLFGEHRRRVPRWFDPERPTAHGQALPARDQAAASEGQRAFFAASLAPAMSEAFETFTALTGHAAGLISRHDLADAKRVVVAQGAAVEAARAAGAYLRRYERGRIGVVGLNWRTPLASEKIAGSLARAGVVTVLERGGARQAPLLGEIRAAVNAAPPVLIAADYAHPSAGEVMAACRNMLAEEPRTVIHLGVEPPSDATSFPKRQALLHRLRRDYPELERVAAPTRESIDVRPVEAKTVTVCLAGTVYPETAAVSMADALSATLGACVRGRIRSSGAGLWEWTLTFASQPFADPGGDCAADLLLVVGLESWTELDLSQNISRRGSLVLFADVETTALAEQLPAAWRDAIAGLELDVFRAKLSAESAATSESLSRTAAALAAGETETLERLDGSTLAVEHVSRDEAALPLAVRRFGEAGETFDNVARFWGELVQPRTIETAPGTVPDPYLASGAVPACTSTFRDRSAGRDTIPQIDAERCTGCGRCWSSCPDAAIAPVALGTEALLDAAAGLVDARSGRGPDEAGAKLRRAHKQMAAKIDGLLSRSERGALADDVLGEAFDWLVEKMTIPEREQAGFAAAFELTREQLARMPLSVTRAFFRQPHAEMKGSGELLMLAVNPQSCQGCGICASVCPDEAIERRPQTNEDLKRLRELWQVWEELPDTAGATIARLAKDPEVGPLAAVLLSRHCTLSLAGGEGAEPGSGERLAVRQVTAVLEFQMQRRILVHLEELRQLERRLREEIRGALADAVDVENLSSLEAALRELGADRAAAGELLSRLDRLGERTDVDALRIARLVELARDVERARKSLTEGAHGVGRARYGVVLAGGADHEWAGRFPYNAFSVPLTVDLASDGAEVTVGLLHSLLAQRVEEARLVRRAELWLENPTDLPARDRELRELAWSELTAEELALCPPILLLVGSDALNGREQAGLSRLLTIGLPAKVLLLDACDLTSGAADARLLALAHRTAYVLSASLADTDHLFDGVSAALQHSGAALIQVHAPSPRRHGFPTDATIERAARAVDARVHPLLRYDPAAEGVFGLRLSLAGNPAVDQAWTADADGQDWTPERWAAAESRYQHSTLLPDARSSAQPTVPGPNGRSLALGEILSAANETRRQVWSTLQELAGVVTPFTAALREAIEKQVADRRAEELAALRAEYEAKLEATDREQLAAQTDRLRRRLLRLAGYGEGKAS